MQTKKMLMGTAVLAISGVMLAACGGATNTKSMSSSDKMMSDKKMAKSGSYEKCAGIVKAGMNDCATSQHACAGHSKVDKAPDEWIKLPHGTCKRIGGKVV